MDRKDGREKDCKSLKKAVKGSVTVIVDADVTTAPQLEPTLNALFLSLNDSLPTAVIVVLDNTVPGEYKAKLGRYSSLQGFSVIESPRTGRGYAQVYAVGYAMGDILAFLQSGVWVYSGWLEELVLHLNADRASIVYPHYNTYYMETEQKWIERIVFAQRVASFEKVDFRLTMIPDYQVVGLIKSPAFRGDVFAIKKEYYDYLGGFDPTMLGDRGMYLELSLRVWMCAGSVKVESCAGVAAIDVDSIQTISKESQVRIARLWMTQPYERKTMTREESLHRDWIDAADAQRAKYDVRMVCKVRFPVYHNVFIEKVEALEDTTQLFLQPQQRGKLISGDICVALDKDDVTLKSDTADKCNSNDPDVVKRHTFVFKSAHVVHTSGLCLAASLHHSVKLDTCLRDEPAQRWEYTKDKAIKSQKHSTCMMNVYHPMYGPNYIMLQPCNTNSQEQQWEFK